MRKTQSVKVPEKKKINRTVGSASVAYAGPSSKVENHRRNSINANLRQRYDIMKYRNLSVFHNTESQPVNNYTCRHSSNEIHTQMLGKHQSKIKYNTQTNNTKLKQKNQTNMTQNLMCLPQRTTLNINKQKVTINNYKPTDYHSEVKHNNSQISVSNKSDKCVTENKYMNSNSKEANLKEIFQEIQSFREQNKTLDYESKVHIAPNKSGHQLLTARIHEIQKEMETANEKGMETIDDFTRQEKSSSQSSSSKLCVKSTKLENAVNVFGSIIEPEEAEVLKSVLHLDSLTKQNIEDLNIFSNDTKLIHFADNLLKKTNEYLAELEFHLDMDNKILSEHSQLLKNLSNVNFSQSENQDEEILHVKKIVDKYFMKSMSKMKIDKLVSSDLDVGKSSKDKMCPQEIVPSTFKNMSPLKLKGNILQNSSLIHSTAVQSIKEVKSLFRKQNFDLKDKFSSRSLNHISTKARSPFNETVKSENLYDMELIKSLPVVPKNISLEIKEKSSIKENKSLVSVKHVSKIENNIEESKPKLTIQDLPSININGTFQIQSIPPINIKPTSNTCQKTSNNVAVLEIKHSCNKTANINIEKENVKNVCSQTSPDINESCKHNAVQERTINDVYTDLKQEEHNCNLNLLLDIVKSIERKLGPDMKISDTLDKDTIQNKPHTTDQSVLINSSSGNLPTSHLQISKQLSSEVNSTESSQYSSFEKLKHGENLTDSDSLCSGVKQNCEATKRIPSRDISEKTEDNVSSLLASICPSVKCEGIKSKKVRRTNKSQNKKTILNCVHELNEIIQNFQKLHLSERNNCNCTCEEKIECIAQKFPVNHAQWENMIMSIELLTEKFKNHESNQLKLKEDIQNTIDKNLKWYQKERIEIDGMSNNVDTNKNVLQPIKKAEYIPYTKLSPGGASGQIKNSNECNSVEITPTNKPVELTSNEFLPENDQLSNEKKIIESTTFFVSEERNMHLNNLSNNDNQYRSKIISCLVDNYTQSNEISMVNSASQIELKHKSTEKSTQYENSTNTVSTETEIISNEILNDDTEISADKNSNVELINLKTSCLEAGFLNETNMLEKNSDEQNVNQDKEEKLKSYDIVSEKVNIETQTIPNVSQEYIDHAGQFILENLNSVRLYNSSCSTLYSTETFKRGSKHCIETEQSSSSSDNDVFSLAKSQLTMSNIPAQNYSTLSQNSISPGEKLPSVQNMNKNSRVLSEQITASTLHENHMKPNSLSDGEIILPCDCSCSFGELHICQKSRNLKSILKKAPLKSHRNTKSKFQENRYNKSSSTSTLFSDVVSNVESSEEVSSDGHLQ